MTNSVIVSKTKREDDDEVMKGKETNELFGVRICPIDPLNRSFGTHTSRYPLDISYHKRFTRKPILKLNSKTKQKIETEPIKYDEPLKIEHVNITSEKDSNQGVKWCVLHVREYDITIGDNPSVQHGVPLSLDWCYVNLGVVDVDEFEQKRGPRRLANQMMMSRKVRISRLKYSCEITSEELTKHEQEIRKAKSARMRTNAYPPVVHDVQVFVQSAIRKSKRLFGKKTI